MSGFQYLPQPVTLFLIYYILSEFFSTLKFREWNITIYLYSDQENPEIRGVLNCLMRLKKKNACINAS